MRSTRWFQPVFALLLGLVLLAVSSVGGHASRGAVGLGVMTAFALVLRLGGRSETLRGLRGDGREERFELIRLQASSLAGRVLILVVVAAFWSRWRKATRARPIAG